MDWRRLNGERLSGEIEAIVEPILQTETAGNQRLKVAIGTDSQVRGKSTEFATVIVFLRKQHGGFMLINNFSTTQKMSLKERLLLEVTKSIEVAYRLCNLLDKYKVDLEVHADINTNPKFPSNSSLQEAMGYIMSMGFVFKAKPDAFASSSCADKVV